MADIGEPSRYFILTESKDRLWATAEQESIIDAAKTTKDNLLINALAGAAKSTTLQFICKYVFTPTLSLAFNKRIADELGKKLPGHVECKTLNSLGHRTWAQACGNKRLTLDMEKDRRLIRAEIDTHSRSDQKEYWEAMSEINLALRGAVNHGWVPDDMFQTEGLISDAQYREYLEYEVFNGEVPEFLFSFIRRIMGKRIAEAYDGLIDFGDQIYMPTLFGGTFPSYPLVMVDETQDLSPLNHAMLRKIARTSRVIAVGDPWQSIYGFRGAVSNGMEKLKKEFRMTELTLSVSFRCPKEVIRKAWSRVPHMRWPEWAIEGSVQYLSEWGPSTVPDNSAIICRNNAPLFRTALDLIKAGRGVKMLGNDIGPGLIKVLKKLGDEKMESADVHKAIDRWEAEQLKKAKNPGSITDRAECLHVFADAGDTLKAAIAYAEHLFASSGPIQLLSGHKSKGLEWNTVFHLDPWRVPSKYAESEAQIEQELNVRYVIETRAKKELILVNSETFRP